MVERVTREFMTGRQQIVQIDACEHWTRACGSPHQSHRTVIGASPTMVSQHSATDGQRGPRKIVEREGDHRHRTGSPRTFVGKARCYEPMKSYSVTYHVAKERAVLATTNLDVRRCLKQWEEDLVSLGAAGTAGCSR